MFKEIILAFGIAAAISGCASKTKSLSVDQLQNPDVTPKEKWSDAMHVAKAMHFQNIYDIPQNLVHGPQLKDLPSGNTQDISASGNVITAATGVMGGAPMAGVGVGLSVVSLLTSGLGNMEGRVQIAAWVPATEARSFEDAEKVALKAWENARETTFQIVDSRRAATDLAKAGSFMPKSKIEWARETRTNVMPPPLSEQTSSYGPIYISHKGELTNNIYANKGMKHQQAYAELSEALPGWFYIYSPNVPSGENKSPAIIYNSGHSYYFIGK
jgi:hypothetical protein